MLSFRDTSRVAAVVTLALLTGCSGGNIAGPTETLSGRSALRSLLLPAASTRGTGTAVHPFINFAAMAKNKGPTIAISVRGQNANVVDLFTAAGTEVGQFRVPGRHGERHQGRPLRRRHK